MKIRLEKRSFEVLITTSGYEAIDIINKNKPDVIILDVKMPSIDGFETFKEMKRIDKSLVVIFLTGHGSVDDAIKAMVLGAFDYLLKPVNLSVLIERIELALA
jgi:DNA-binding response OmpR family regulator